jgi:hypothetical protein
MNKSIRMYLVAIAVMAALASLFAYVSTSANSAVGVLWGDSPVRVSDAITTSLSVSRDDSPIRASDAMTHYLYLPIVVMAPEITTKLVAGTLDGYYTFASVGATVTDTFHLYSSSITLDWSPISSGTLALPALFNPLGRPEYLSVCFHACVVMVWSLPISGTGNRVTSGTMTFPGLATVLSGKTDIMPDQVPVELRQTNWASASLDGLTQEKALEYWQDTRPGWITYFGEQGGCETSRISIPDSAIRVVGNKVGIMVCPGAADVPDLWQNTPDSRFVYYIHQLRTVPPREQCAPSGISLWMEAYQ